MIKLHIVFFLLIIAAISCSEDEIIKESDVTENKGVWNGLSLERFNSDNELTSKESFDQCKLSIGEKIIQEMMTNPFAPQYLMYSSYEFDKGILKRQPDSIIDIYKNVHYWNKVDSTFSGLSIYAKPFESSLRQLNDKEIIEYRSTNNEGQIKIRYLKIEDESNDLLPEFENYCNSLDL